MIQRGAALASPWRRRSSQKRLRTAQSNLLVVASGALLAVVAVAFMGLPWGWAVGGTAALTAAVVAVPQVSSLAMPVMTYAGVWIGFNLLRAHADGTPWADQMLGVVPHLEVQVFGGTLPSEVLQERHFSLPPAWYDYGWTAVYLSLFIVPHIVAILLLWWHRQLFWRYLLATVGVFTLGMLAFYAVPTAPPWLVTEMVPEGDFGQVVRVASRVASTLDLPVELYHRGLRGSVVVSEVRIEPNPVAAMPSIHFAATALLVPMAWQLRRGLGLIALIYTLLMGAALVYLGEHYILDLVVGGLFVGIGWIAAVRALDRGQGASKL